MNNKIVLLITVALLLGSLCSAAQGLYVPPKDGLHPSAPKVPAYAVFCGDTIRFDTVEKYERMDRELMNFSYMHTTTSLMLKRSGRYFPQVEPMLKAAGVPDDFKYLMVIESNLDPKAVSVSGAAGLWQFTKATAREYGMMVNNEVDERFNIEKETTAACQYILRAYSRFRNWFNVAASYNCGMGGMITRIADQKQDDFEDLWLPEETSRYVYRILVAKMLFADPSAFGFDIDERYPYNEPLHTVTVSGPIESLVDFAEQYGVTYAELKRANLWLRDNKLVNKEQKTYKIIIPRPGRI
ncbi:MAG: lytic transglycosylase domain-containing protein [Bacteroidales bacterium]|nr:lytic transglycosylase domain-containing protein [Bacteroidales bacterium]